MQQWHRGTGRLSRLPSDDDADLAVPHRRVRRALPPLLASQRHGAAVVRVRRNDHLIIIKKGASINRDPRSSVNSGAGHAGFENTQQFQSLTVQTRIVFKV